MEFFLLYVFVQIEKIAALLSIGSDIFFTAGAFSLLTYGISVFLSKNKEEMFEYIGKMKRYRRMSTCVAVIGALMFVSGALLPSKKDLAIIVAGGMTYNVITSPEAKELGGKALELLKKQMDDALKDVDVKDAIKETAKKELKNAITS